MTYKYQLSYPNGMITDIEICYPIQAGQTLVFGKLRFLIVGIEHHLKPQRFDSSITHEVVTIVQLELIS